MQQAASTISEPLPAQGVIQVMIAAAAANPMVTFLVTATLIGLWMYLNYKLKSKKIDADLMKTKITQDVFLKVKKVDSEVEKVKLETSRRNVRTKKK